MGDTAGADGEKLGISREQQDALAHRSHPPAAKAWEEGKLSAEVMTAYAPPFREPLEQDNNIRKIQRSQIIRSYARPLTANMAPSPPPTVRR